MSWRGLIVRRWRFVPELGWIVTSTAVYHDRLRSTIAFCGDWVTP